MVHFANEYIQKCYPTKGGFYCKSPPSNGEYSSAKGVEKKFLIIQNTIDQLLNPSRRIRNGFFLFDVFHHHLHIFFSPKPISLKTLMAAIFGYLGRAGELFTTICATMLMYEMIRFLPLMSAFIRTIFTASSCWFNLDCLTAIGTSGNIYKTTS